MSGSFLQGGALPDVKETTTSTTTPTSTEYSKLLSDISSAGSGALTKLGPDGKPIAKTGADLVAGYDPMQTLGYNALPGAVNAHQPGLDAAQQTASRAAAGITPGRIQSLMNPYTTNVVNEMARLSQQNVERNLMPSMKAGFVGTGGLGSKRYADAFGQSMADVQGNLTGAQTGALSAGFTQALKGALDEAQLQNLAAKTQGDLAKMEQQLGIEGAGALTKAGAERQGYQQAILDAPLKNAKNAADLLRGYTMPGTEEKTFTGPRTKDYYQSSDAQRLGGLATFLGSANTEKVGDLLSRYGTKFVDYLTGKSNIVDLGSGLSLKFDSRTNAPYIEGASTGWLPSEDPLAQILKDAGYQTDETGTLFNPNLDYNEYNFNYAGG
jgi:hypothetical protein